jgi:hypothetical protein
MENTTNPARMGTVNVEFDYRVVPAVVRAEYDGVALMGISGARRDVAADKVAEIHYMVERVSAIRHDGKTARVVEITETESADSIRFTVTVELPS